MDEALAAVAGCVRIHRILARTMKPATTALRRVYQAVGSMIGPSQSADSKGMKSEDTNGQVETDPSELPPPVDTSSVTVTGSTEESMNLSSTGKGSNQSASDTKNEGGENATSNGNAEISLTNGRPTRKRKPKVDAFLITQEPRKLKPKQKKKRPDPEEEFESSWICCECKEAECMMKPEADQLLICEGTCRRLFHYPCAGLAELPAEDEVYICSDCTNQRHPCAICQEYGHDDEDVFVCNKDECGLFFHEHCLVMQNVEVQVNQEEEAKIVSEQRDKMPVKGSAARKTAKRNFICPAHWCWTCTQRDEQEKEKEAEKEAAGSAKKKGGRKKKSKSRSSAFDCKREGRIIRCLECPTSYHITCIPPLARFHELAMLCHEHAATHKLPELDPETSIQGTIEKQIDEKFHQLEMKRERIRQAKGHNLFFPGMQGNRLTKKETKLAESLDSEGGFDSDNLWFCLPCDLKDEVHSKPHSYRHVHSLRYDPENRPSKIPPTGDICECVAFCGEDCLNRMLYVECIGDASRDGGGRKYSNCRVGAGCGNRKIGQRKFAKCAPKREQGKGWGLITQEPLLRGDLVLEYVGEVIDAKTKEKRLQEWTTEHPNDPNFYIMSLRDQWFIDARHEANLSRFINHSCEPNCVLMQINVGGFIRNGIFAIRDICAGEFLSYDYHFDTRHADQFICRCGSAKCRGTMKGGVSTLPNAKKSQKELWEEAKSRYERDKKFLEEYYEGEKTRHTQVAATVPAAENKDETVANGVQDRYVEETRMHRIFLWRNALQGSDFSSRLERLQNKS